ncbi:hypothetical protein N7481_010965 [Penicillium waksmanii]|uniref:uncharacterized protein n=1 Tax=Penicillium waksmanii TaxID=69791 RepID=UPI00254867C7|nr:uncharacterized protein N7481_010965 [Penicillium waksmanii]KAJ5973755.1 hypothetical protein N7481_010965 [Penicillium waksmanii]
MSQNEITLEYLKAKRHLPARLQAEGYFLGILYMTKDQRAGKRALRDEDYLLSPKVTFPASSRTAIVLDCEMVGVAGGRSAVVSLSAIDFCTGEVLINDIVNPTEKVVDWRARYSGVSLARMRRACASGEALRGWKAARQKLWQFMDADTILIGHSLDNDLEVLGILHHNIVDTAILTAEAVFLPISHTTRMSRRWGLKPLVDEFLNRDIQVGKGHSALEDACATRDVLFWCMCNPHLLHVWAGKNRIKEEKRVADEKAKRAANAEKRLAADTKKKLAAEAKERKRTKEREVRKSTVLQKTASNEGYDDGNHRALESEAFVTARLGHLVAVPLQSLE